MERIILWVIAFLCFGVTEGAPNRGMVIATFYSSGIWKLEGPPRMENTSLDGFSQYLSPFTDITSIDSDYSNNTLFYADAFSGEIYKISNFEFATPHLLDISVVHATVSESLILLAFDVVAKNLYWTDGHYKWIAMKPAYSEDPTDYRVIIDRDIAYLTAITIDPYDGYMFFADTWKNTRIERATLAGQERRGIIHSGLLQIFSMTLDPSSNTLYWADLGRQTIESSDYDGNNRIIIDRSTERNWFSIDFHGGYLFAVSFLSSMVYIVDAANKTVTNKFDANLPGFPSAIHYFDNETVVDFNNTCQYKGCSDICVNTPSGPTCMCKEGSILQTDSVTCSDPTDFYGKGILFSNISAVCMLEIQIITGLVNFTVPCINFPDANITSIAADVSNHLIFYLDSKNNSLMEYNVISQQNAYLTSVTSDASSLIYDWNDSILLWVEESSREIKAYTRTTRYVTTLYSFDADISYLTADFHFRKLFWLSGAKGNESIMIGDFHGGNSSKLFTSTELTMPSLLYFDIQTHRLFWVNDYNLRSTSLDGTGIRNQAPINSNSSHFLIYKEFAVWIADGMFYSRSFDGRSTFTTDDIFNGYGDVTSWFVYDINVQKPEPGPCEIMNGGCEDICLPGNGVPICKCDIGLQLEADNKTCTSGSPLLQSDFLMVTDFHHGRALQISLTDGSLINTDIDMIYPTASTFDKSRNEVVWFEQYTNFLFSFNIYGNKSSAPSASFYGAEPVAMDIDYSTGSIYFIANDYSGGFIGVVNQLSSSYKTIFSPYDDVGGITLYPKKGLIFSSEYGYFGPIVSRVNMDGSGYTELIFSDVSKPMGLAIDFSADLLYWTDNGLNRIERCDFKGGSRFVINTALQPAYLDIYGDYLYYTSLASQKVLKVNKNTTEHMDFMSDNPELGKLSGITAVPGDPQPISTACATRNGNCSRFCFPTPTGRVCGCDNFNYLVDETICSDVTICPSSLLNGMLDASCTRLPNTTCNFTCSPGYLPKGDRNSLTCDDQGSWNEDTNNICLPLKCSNVIDNGSFKSSCTFLPDERCMFECDPKYISTVGMNQVHCGFEGAWDKDVNTLCKGPFCPSSLLNGTVDASCTRLPNTTCPFTCFPGYVPKDGRTSLTCDDQGSWNEDTNNICLPLKCPNVIDNGFFKSSCTFLPDARCLFECDPNYISTVGMVQVHCGFKGAWDRDINKLCREAVCPNTVANGNLSSTCTRRSETRCPFQCDPGFQQQMGVTFLYCDFNGEWNYDVNTICQPLKCLNNVTNGRLGADCPRSANTTCALTCNDRYRPDDGISSLTCNFDGNWNKNVKTVCREIDCGNTSMPVLLSPGCATVVDSQCTYQCARGYRKSTNVTSLTCQKAGNWSFNPVNLCTEIMCPATIPDSKTIISSCSKKYQSKCDFECSDGYRKSSKLSSVMCLESGQWEEPTYPLCEAVKVEEPKADEAAMIVGIVAGSLFLIVLIIIIGVLCLRKQQRNQKFEKQRLASLKQDMGSSVYHEISPDGRSRGVSNKGFQNPQYENTEKKGASNDNEDLAFTKL